MGTRGKLPAITFADAEPLDNLEPPEHLDDEARAYWSRHLTYLTGNHILNNETADSFALLCSLWSRTRSMAIGETSRAYLDTVKAYQTLAKLFRLLPTEKGGTPTVHRHADKMATPDFEF